MRGQTGRAPIFASGDERRVPHSFALFANEWVLRSAAVPKLLHGTRFDLQRPLLIVHSHQTTLTARVGAKAAPLPLAGLDHQSALHWVAVHVAQLFDALPFAINIEVVEALLPNRVESRIPECGLGGGWFTAPVEFAGEAFFDNFHDDRGITDFGFGDEQMKVFGHDDVSVNDEAVPAAGLFEDFEEEIATPDGVQSWLAAVATTGDEMQVLSAVVADESLGHGGRVLVANRVWM
jgi:hypothetical protein